MVGRARHPLAPAVAQTADIELGMHGVHKDFGALAQHFAGRGHTVGNGEQVAGNTQQHFRVALHGRHGRQQVQQTEE